MQLKGSSFSNFITNKKSVFLFIQAIILYLIFAFITIGMSATNILLTFLLFSNFGVFSFILFTIIAIRSDDKLAIDKWKDVYSKRILMKKKLRFVYFLFGIHLFIMILFIILLSNMISKGFYLKNSLIIQDSFLIFVLLFLEILLTKPFFYWLVDTQLEIGTFSEFNKLITVDLNSSSIILEVLVFFVIMGFSDLIIINYYTKGLFFNSPNFITLILLVKILFILTIYLFIIRKKNQFR